MKAGKGSARARCHVLTEFQRVERGPAQKRRDGYFGIWAAAVAAGLEAVAAFAGAPASADTKPDSLPNGASTGRAWTIVVPGSRGFANYLGGLDDAASDVHPCARGVWLEVVEYGTALLPKVVAARARAARLHRAGISASVVYRPAAGLVASVAGSPIDSAPASARRATVAI